MSKDSELFNIKYLGEKLAKQSVKNKYSALLTRGQKIYYICCEDKTLREYIKRLLMKK